MCEKISVLNSPFFRSIYRFLIRVQQPNFRLLSSIDDKMLNLSCDSRALSYVLSFVFLNSVKYCVAACNNHSLCTFMICFSEPTLRLST
jgi:hypothetical protein